MAYHKASRLLKVAETAEALRMVGVEVVDRKAVLYRGTDVPGLTVADLRYGDFLSAVSSGADATGNLGADAYGKHVERYEIPVGDVEISNGELQYKGRSESLKGGRGYPVEVYRAFNDVNGSNYTAAEIDAMRPDEVRGTASMGLSGGRREFDELTRAFGTRPAPAVAPA